MNTNPSPLNRTTIDPLEAIFATCRRTLGSHTWGRVLAAMGEDSPPPSVPQALVPLVALLELPAYITDLARLEWMLYEKKRHHEACVRPRRAVTVNPTLSLVSVGWKGLAELIHSDASSAAPRPEPAHVLIWRHPQTGAWRCRDAENIDLLALKIVVDEIDPRAAAGLGKIGLGDILGAIDRAVAHGLLLAPESRIRRRRQGGTKPDPSFNPFMSADLFTLQWHITQACDLHCRHCYDRSTRKAMALETAVRVLEDFYRFCRRMYVRGQVTFTGGNPLL
ncbi:MAG TPA: hypothetical protein VLT88_02770, partial [Desulfosarcina sp.]|nr:hypothetical protein [Desulfosarcina sp.]